MVGIKSGAEVVYKRDENTIALGLQFRNCLRAEQ
jgi:hypothetical protein